MVGHPSRAARLADMEQRGYLAIRTDGYPRCEGAFFCPLVERDRIVEYMIQGRPIVFKGTLYHASHSEVVERPVLIGGFAAEGGQLRVRLIGGPPEAVMVADRPSSGFWTDSWNGGARHTESHGLPRSAFSGHPSEP